MKWGMVCKPSKEAFEIGKRIYEMIGDVALESKIASFIGEKGYKIKELGEKCDGIIVIGGDGTILLTLSQVKKPIFSINAGRIGFLTEVDAEDAEKALKEILRGNYFIEESMKIKILLNKKRLPDAVNEMVVHTANLGKILPFKVYIDNKMVKKWSGDGLIVSTPLGSTSYALSLGGPIIEPKMNAFLIVAIAPFRRAFYPLVLSSERKIKIEVEKDAEIAIDGLYNKIISKDDVIEVMASPEKAKFIKINDKFFEKVYKKLEK
ncbi:MAG: NAD(+)/NADH kinase [Thermoplasmatales archaeon]|nr:NAD(+)/NADH kinase [Thermoplasmatales archaeon]